MHGESFDGDRDRQYNQPPPPVDCDLFMSQPPPAPHPPETDETWQQFSFCHLGGMGAVFCGVNDGPLTHPGGSGESPMQHQR